MYSKYKQHHNKESSSQKFQHISTKIFIKMYRLDFSYFGNWPNCCHSVTYLCIDPGIYWRCSKTWSKWYWSEWSTRLLYHQTELLWHLSLVTCQPRQLCRIIKSITLCIQSINISTCNCVMRIIYTVLSTQSCINIIYDKQRYAVYSKLFFTVKRDVKLQLTN